MTYRVDDPGINIGIIVTDFLSNHLVDDCAKLYQWEFTEDFVGSFSATWTVPAELLNEGRYFIDIFVLNNDGKMVSYHDRSIEFNVSDQHRPTLTDLAYRAPISVNLKLHFKPL